MAIRKTMCVILSCVMMAAVVSSCGGNKQQAIQEDTKPTTQTSEVKKEAPLKFSISLRATSTYSQKSPNINEEKWKKEMEKRANVDMNILLIPHNEYTQKMNLMFASGDIPDVVTAYEPNEAALAGSVQAGVFMPLDDLLKKYAAEIPNLMKEIPQIAWDDKRGEDGKIYAVPEYVSKPNARTTYIRKDFLEKYNLKVPKTLDEFVNVLKVFKQNGVKYPYSGRENWNYTDVFFGAFNAFNNTWIVNDRQELIPAMVTPNMKEALKFHRMLNEQGLMHPESLTLKSDAWEKHILNGETALFCSNISSFPGWNMKLKAVNPQGEFMMIGGPVGPDGKHGMFNYAPSLRGAYINAKFKEPARLLKYFDWQLKPESQEFFAFGIEGETYTKKDGKIEYTYPTEQDKKDLQDFRLWLNFIRDGQINKLLMPYTPGGKEILEFYAKIAPEDQRSWYDPGELENLKNVPELSPKSPDLWRQYAAKIYFGQAPVDDFDKFVQEYMKRGGDKVIKEATDKYKKGLAKKR